jgi:probable addiction module antidote protein
MSTTTTLPEGFSNFDSADYLKTEADARAYFSACIEDDPGDGSLIRYALGTIARAKSMSVIAKDTGLARESLYRALSPEGNPEFSTIMRVCHALDLQFTLKPRRRAVRLVNAFNAA